MKKYLLLLIAMPLFAQGTHSNVISWEPSPSVGVGYNLYKSAGQCAIDGAVFRKINAVPLTATTFTDTGMVDGEVNCYYIKSVSGDGTESDPSGTLELTTPRIVAQKKPYPPGTPRGVGN